MKSMSETNCVAGRKCLVRRAGVDTKPQMFAAYSDALWHVFPSTALCREGAGHPAHRATAGSAQAVLCPTCLDGRAWGHLYREHILSTRARHHPGD